MIKLIVVIAFILVICWCVIGLVRNRQVAAYRSKLIDETGKASEDDINNGVYDWKWRWDAFEAVDYDRMVREFWKPLDSFYPDKRFTQTRRQERETPGNEVR